MGLKDILKAAFGPNDLGPSIDEFLVKRPKDDRADGWHPSAFSGMCARRSLLEVIISGKMPDSIIPKSSMVPDVKLERIFDVGKALHAWYQNEYFGKMGSLWGRWRSLSSDTVHWGFKPHGGSWEYNEVPVKAALEGCTYPIVGRCDGIVFIRNEFRLLELKTINDRGFGKLSEAKPEHVVQAQIYAELICQGLIPGVPKQSELKPLAGINILYINKNDSSEREFKLPLDQKLALRVLKQPVLYEVGLRMRVIPSREDCSPDCINPICYKAQQCPMKDACFRGTANEISWQDMTGLK
jgi:hypothetical protein